MFIGHLGQEAYVAQYGTLSDLSEGHVRKPEAEDVAHELGERGPIKPIAAFSDHRLPAGRGLEVTDPAGAPIFKRSGGDETRLKAELGGDPEEFAQSLRSCEPADGNVGG